MKRIDYILVNTNFKRYLKNNETYEADRVFCRHDLNHLLSTARIAYIICLEKKLNLDKELIYAAALLHDIGRWKQYEDGIPHEEASCMLAKPILEECGFKSEEIYQIISAIETHRNKDLHQYDLAGILSLSDKLSRNCFDCSASKMCNWKEDKKNYKIIY